MADLDATKATVLTQMAGVCAQRAEVSRSEVNLADVKRDYERKQILVEKGFVSSADRDKAQAVYNGAQEQLKTARAQLAVAEAQAKTALAVVKQRESQLAQTKVDLDRTIIRAPVDGVVIKRSVDAGQTVAASLQAPELFQIAQNLRDMQVEASIDEADVGRVKLDQNATFSVDSFPGRTFSGKVMQVRKAATVVQNVVTYTVVIAAANPDLQLLPGMTANVRITTDRRDSVLKLPNAALRFRPAGFNDAGANSASSGAAPAPAPATGGGEGQQLRQRLVAALNLDADQQAKLDTIFAELRKAGRGARVAGSRTSRPAHEHEPKCAPSSWNFSSRSRNRNTKKSLPNPPAARPAGAADAGACSYLKRTERPKRSAYAPACPTAA